MRYIPALTGLRALAASSVLLLHTAQNVPESSLTGYFDMGYLGVDLFFILSGFIITHVYLESLGRFKSKSLAVFLWHRLIRLWPVHATMLVVLVVMVYLARATGIEFRQSEAWQEGDIVWHLVLLHAWGPAHGAGWNAPSWSISAEWFAYLLFPLLAIALARTQSSTAALAIAASALTVALVALWAAGWQLNSWVGGPALIRVSGEFTCGVALSRSVMLGGAGRSGDFLGIGALVAFALGALSGASDYILAGLLAPLVFGAATSHGPLEKVLALPPVVWLGAISYSLYMVHFPVLIVSRHAFETAGYVSSSGRIGLMIIFVIISAAGMYYLIERPARTRLRHLGALDAASPVEA